MSTAPLPSPCTQVCTMDPATGLCAGCLRTLDEIAAWGRLDEAGKRHVWERLALRRAERSRGHGDVPRPAGETALARSESDAEPRR
jgi:predicted Fe-S protein YdhL (DUF1289 family)